MAGLRCHASSTGGSLRMLPISVIFGATYYMQTSYNGIPVPANGKPIEYSNGTYTVPDHPIVPFIEGDGTGRDIWKASQRVFDAAVEKSYGGKRKMEWYEVLAGQKADLRQQNCLPSH